MQHWNELPEAMAILDDLRANPARKVIVESWGILQKERHAVLDRADERVDELHHIINRHFDAMERQHGREGALFCMSGPSIDEAL